MSASQTALIIDDEDQLLRLMTRVLDRAGFTTLTASDASEALHVFEERIAEIDFVILDVILPGSGASEILPELLARKPDLKIILTSGDSLPPELEAELASIRGDFLRKPFVPRTLLRLVGSDPHSDDASMSTASTADSRPGSA